jgi:hypothetical protein
MTKIRGTIREWHADEGWGVFDSPETPGGCWVAHDEALPGGTAVPLTPGTPVRFSWVGIEDRPIRGYKFQAFSFYAVDEALALDDEDYELIDLEEPVIDDEISENPNIESPVQTYGIAVKLDEKYMGGSTSSDIDSASPETLPAERFPDSVSRLPGFSDLENYDPEFIMQISEFDNQSLRALARRCTHKAYEYAGLAKREWVIPALEALDLEMDPPAPFHDIQSVFSRWLSERSEFACEVSEQEASKPPANAFDHGSANLPYHAIPAYFTASEPDPLIAAYKTLLHASHTFGANIDQLFNSLREEFIEK